MQLAGERAEIHPAPKPRLFHARGILRPSFRVVCGSEDSRIEIHEQPSARRERFALKLRRFLFPHRRELERVQVVVVNAQVRDAAGETLADRHARVRGQREFHARSAVETAIHVEAHLARTIREAAAREDPREMVPPTRLGLARPFRSAAAGERARLARSAPCEFRAGRIRRAPFHDGLTALRHVIAPHPRIHGPRAIAVERIPRRLVPRERAVAVEGHRQHSAKGAQRGVCVHRCESPCRPLEKAPAEIGAEIFDAAAIGPRAHFSRGVRLHTAGGMQIDQQVAGPVFGEKMIATRVVPPQQFAQSHVPFVLRHVIDPPRRIHGDVFPHVRSRVITHPQPLSATGVKNFAEPVAEVRFELLEALHVDLVPRLVEHDGHLAQDRLARAIAAADERTPAPVILFLHARRAVELARRVRGLERAEQVRALAEKLVHAVTQRA